MLAGKTQLAIAEATFVNVNDCRAAQSSIHQRNQYAKELTDTLLKEFS